MGSLRYGCQTISDEDVEAVARVLRSDWLTQGPAVERFEAELVDRFGSRYAIVMSSGTAALHLAAVATGIGPGDRVITSPLSFVASANCIRYAGALPTFVDVFADTLNLDATAVENLLATDPAAENLRGIVAVHFAGLAADMECLARSARRRGMFIIEDASHAIGSSWQDDSGDWHTVGSCSHSDATVFSFHPVKTLTTAEGGAVLTNDSVLAERVRSLRTHGIRRPTDAEKRSTEPWFYEMEDLGFNYRLSDLHCALGSSQLVRLQQWIDRRSEVVARYQQRLGADPRIEFVREPASRRSAWHLFTIRVPNRAQVYHYLHAHGIGVQVHYIPIHLHPYYRRLLGTSAGDFPNAERYYAGALSLPLYPTLSNVDVDRVVDTLLRALDVT